MRVRAFSDQQIKKEEERRKKGKKSEAGMMRCNVDEAWVSVSVGRYS